MRDILNYFTYYSSYPFRSIFAYISSSSFSSFLSLRVVRHSETLSMGQNWGQNLYAFLLLLINSIKQIPRLISSYYNTLSLSYFFRHDRSNPCNCTFCLISLSKFYFRVSEHSIFCDIRQIGCIEFFPTHIAFAVGMKVCFFNN